MKNISDLYPLSPMQELMLVHALSRPQIDLLFNQIVFTLDGSLDTELMERSWADLIQRHPILRTIFLWEGLMAPVQVVRDTAQLEWQYRDWSTLSNEEQNTRLQTLLQEDRKQGFKLSRAPLMRFCLCRRRDNLHTLIWSSHHLILDRWCISLLLSEFAGLYEAYRTESNVELEPPAPFRNYISWLGKQKNSDAEEFWRNELTGITQPTRIEGDRMIGIEPEIGEIKHRIDLAFTSRIRQFSANHHVTLGTVVLGAWAMLHRLTNQPGDVVLGVTISGRPPTLPGVERIIGPFINNVPLRVNFPDQQPVNQWLQALQNHQQTVQTFGYVSPQEFQELSEIPNAASPFETLFLYQSSVKMPHFSIRMIADESTLQTNYPLTLAAADEAEGLLVSFIYNRHQYNQETITWLKDTLLKALTLIVDQSELTIFHLVARMHDAFSSIGQRSIVLQESSEHIIRYQPPRNGLEARLVNVWTNVLGHQRFGVKDNIFNLGTTSIQAVQVVSRIRQMFDNELPLAALFTAPTIEQLAGLLADGTPIPEWSSLVPIKPSGNKLPLFLVHHGGGGIFGYGEVSRYMDVNRPLYGLQEPGIENGQELPRSVEEIASVYVREIQTVQEHGPYFIGGFCFGGVVAFEMAQQLQRTGEQVKALILLDAVLPGYAPQPDLQQRLVRHRASINQYSLPKKITYLVLRIARRALWEVMRRLIVGRRIVEHMAFHLLEWANRPVPSALRQRRLLELNGQLNDAYKPSSYAGYTILVRGTYPELHYSEDFGWNSVIKPEVSIFHMNTEDHLRMLAEPHIHTLIQHLRTALNQAEASDPKNHALPINRILK